MWEIVHAAGVVEMGEHPATALRRRDDTSIGVATRLVKDGRADAVVSAGNTGATMAAALLILGRVRGIDRPALCGMLPVTSAKRATCLLDAGATMDASARNLVQYARMATSFMEKVHGVARPSIGLINVGEEDEKGDKLRSIVCPYHAWTFDLNGDLRAAAGFKNRPGFRAGQWGLLELPVAAQPRLGRKTV